MMALLHKTFHTVARNNFTIEIDHIAGTDNCIANTLSRLQVQRFQQLATNSSIKGRDITTIAPDDHQLQYFQYHAIAPSTRHCYQTGIKWFKAFCAHGLWPTSELSPSASSVQMSQSTIKLYMSEVRFWHNEGGYHEPTVDTPLLLKGFLRCRGHN